MLNIKGRSFLTPATDTENLANALNYDKYKGHKYYGRLTNNIA